MAARRISSHKIFVLSVTATTIPQPLVVLTSIKAQELQERLFACLKMYVETKDNFSMLMIKSNSVERVPLLGWLALGFPTTNLFRNLSQ